jgi:hypothetical protein
LQTRAAIIVLNEIRMVCNVAEGVSPETVSRGLHKSVGDGKLNWLALKATKYLFDLELGFISENVVFGDIP